MSFRPENHDNIDYKVTGSLGTCWIVTKENATYLVSEDKLVTKVDGDSMAIADYLMTKSNNLYTFYKDGFDEPVLRLTLQSSITGLIKTKIGYIMYDLFQFELLLLEINNNNLKKIPLPTLAVALTYAGVYFTNDKFISWEDIMVASQKYINHDNDYIKRHGKIIHTGTDIELFVVKRWDGLLRPFLGHNANKLIAHSSSTHKMLWSMDVNSDVSVTNNFIVCNGSVFDLITGQVAHNDDGRYIYCARLSSNTGEIVCGVRATK